MFRPYQIYKHKNNTDVAINIVKSFYVKEKQRYNLKVRWINIGSHPWQDMNIVQRINIQNKDLLDWKLVTENSVDKSEYSRKEVFNA